MNYASSVSDLRRSRGRALTPDASGLNGTGTNRIVVGVDGSPPSWDALHWAIGEAHRWRAALRVVVVNGIRPRVTARTSESFLARMVSDARRLEPSIRITGDVRHGDVVPALREASHESLMVVVGRRDQGGTGRLPSGSTSVRIAAEAPVPVTVVRGHRSGEGPVVVGVDGRAGSDAALGLALDEARLRRCAVVAVLAYSQPVEPWPAGNRPLPSDPQLLHASAFAALESAVAPWREKFPDVAMRTTTAATTPIPFLTSLSRYAQLIVVGTHGHDHLTEPLGSVPERLLNRARCPVMIAR